MRAFEVSLNGKKLCLAGIGDEGVLVSNVDWVTGKGRKDLFLTTGGLISSTDEHLRWISQKPIHVGDTIQIRVLETNSVDKPRKRFRSHPAEQLKAKKRYVRLLAKELGWKIQERPK